MAKTKADAPETEHEAHEEQPAAPVERRAEHRMTDAEIKRWVRKELELHAAGVDHNERGHQNP